VTKKGIWGTGLLALAALATMCTWQHRPEQVTNTAATVVAPQVVLAPKVSPAAMPPVVTGPSKAMTPATTAAAAEVIAPAVVAPAVVAPVVVAPPAPQAVSPQAAMPAVVAPIAEAKPEPKAVPQVVDIKPEAKLAAPAMQRKAFAKSAKSAKSAKPLLGKVKTVEVNKAKKRAKLLKTAKASGCEFRRDQNVVKSICFNFNSDRLSARSKSKLDALVPSLKSGDKRYELNGFADSVGTKTYNSGLSERRNQSVLKYLQSKGVDASKLSAKGNGSDEASKLGAGKNQRERRVDVRVL
jgi:outer membrane protein OmpA-like peptidoglycan-associated protein